jgi:hypothetical protein
MTSALVYSAGAVTEHDDFAAARAADGTTWTYGYRAVMIGVTAVGWSDPDRERN